GALSALAFDWHGPAPDHSLRAIPRAAFYALDRVAIVQLVSLATDLSTRQLARDTPVSTRLAAGAAVQLCRRVWLRYAQLLRCRTSAHRLGATPCLRAS